MILELFETFYLLCERNLKGNLVDKFVIEGSKN